MRQVLTNTCPGATSVLSGMVTSATQAAASPVLTGAGTVDVGDGRGVRVATAVWVMPAAAVIAAAVCVGLGVKVAVCGSAEGVSATSSVRRASAVCAAAVRTRFGSDVLVGEPLPATAGCQEQGQDDPRNGNTIEFVRHSYSCNQNELGARCAGSIIPHAHQPLSMKHSPHFRRCPAHCRTSKGENGGM